MCHKDHQSSLHLEDHLYQKLVKWKSQQNHWPGSRSWSVSSAQRLITGIFTLCHRESHRSTLCMFLSRLLASLGVPYGSIWITLTRQRAPCDVDNAKSMVWSWTEPPADMDELMSTLTMSVLCSCNQNFIVYLCAKFPSKRWVACWFRCMSSALRKVRRIQSQLLPSPLGL